MNDSSAGSEWLRLDSAGGWEFPVVTKRGKISAAAWRRVKRRKNNTMKRGKRNAGRYTLQKIWPTIGKKNGRRDVSWRLAALDIRKVAASCRLFLFFPLTLAGWRDFFLIRPERFIIIYQENDIWDTVLNFFATFHLAREAVLFLFFPKKCFSSSAPPFL